jgi:3-oxoacyl-[acyl-carrier protein] reductase
MNATTPHYPDLPGKVAVVTGGSHGIGAETVRLLAANGVKVAINGQDQDAVEDRVREAKARGSEAVGFPADITRWENVEGLRHRSEATLGPTDILVACVGGGRTMPGPVVDVTEEEWRSSIDGNLTATFLAAKSFLPGMIERRHGAIITMASSAARIASPAPAAYAAAKAGVIMFTKHLAAEVGKYGIRVNCVSPSAVLVERTKMRMREDQKAMVAAAHPLGRIGEPVDVANAVLFLASDASSWITGITLDVAGGRVSL